MTTARSRWPGRAAAVVAPVLALVLVLALALAVVATRNRPPTGGLAVEPSALPASPEPSEVAPPSPSPSPSLPPSPPPLSADLRDLGERLRALISSDDFATASAAIGVAVRDAAGRHILDLGAEQVMLPASTLKLVTAAAALEVLGPEYRFVTPVRATVPIDSFGYLDGDLVLIGVGDPLLATQAYRTHVYPSRPHTPLEQLADAVAATGLRWVSGDVVGDGTAFGPATTAPGWTEEYLAQHDARRIGALGVDAGLDVAVEIPEEGPVAVELTLTPNLPLHAAETLRLLLEERGIHVDGGARAARRPVDAPAPVASVASPPLREMLRFMVQRSDNPIADTLVRAVGHAAGGDGSFEDAGVRVAAALAGLGIDVTGLEVHDGSGLSRLNRLRPALLADLDRVMSGGPDGEVWRSLQAVAGESGTLAGRLRDTIGAGRLRGKTGTLDDVRALVVAVDGAATRLHLALIANDARADGWTVTVLADELALRLVEFVDGCTRVLTSEPAASASPPIVRPYELECPAA